MNGVRTQRRVSSFTVPIFVGGKRDEMLNYGGKVDGKHKMNKFGPSLEKLRALICNC